jgi:hypothetical protein
VTNLELLKAPGQLHSDHKAFWLELTPKPAVKIHELGCPKTKVVIEFAMLGGVV